MADLEAQFEQARAYSKNLPEKPDNLTMLKLHGLYEQGMAGDVVGSPPDLNDMVGRAKWEAWSALKGTPVEQAQQAYIDLINSLGSPD